MATSKKKRSSKPDPFAPLPLEKVLPCLRKIDPTPHRFVANKLDARYGRCGWCGRFMSAVASQGFLGAPLGIHAEPVSLFGDDLPPAQERAKRTRKKAA